MKQYLEQLRALFERLTPRQRILTAAAALAVIGGIAGLRHWQTEKNYKPLFQKLAGEDAGQVIAVLRERAVDYRLADDGSTIRIPSEKVDETRIQLAAAGLPKAGRIGYEIFDKTNFGASEFTEQVNYHRAVEGELERSVMSLQEVESARVHITFPRKSLFMENQQAAKASVLVKLKPAAALDKQNIQAIAHLASSAVDGLTPENVSILDMRGNLLSKPGKKDDDEQELAKAVSEYRRKTEEELLKKIHQTLQPLLGESGFRAAVSLDCDLTSGDQSEETFDPSRSVMLNSQKSEDGSTPAAAGGVPGTASNLPRPTVPPAGRPGTPAFRRSENTTFQTSRIVRHLKLPQGQIRKLSVSVLIDYMTRTDGTKKVVEPAAPERVRAIKDLVSAAVGFQQERGDQVIVESIPFESTRNPDPPPSQAAPVAASHYPRITLPANIPPYVRVPMEGHLNWLIQQNWLPAAAGTIALVILYGLYRLLRKIGAGVVSAAKKSGSFVASKIKRKKDKGQHVDVTLDPALEGRDDVAKLESGAEMDPRKSIEQQLQERDAERERLTKEALLQLEVPKAEVRKGEVISRHLNELILKDSENVSNLIRTWVPELEK